MTYPINAKISKVIAALGAGTATTNGDILDMAGFEAVTFVGGCLGTVNAGNYFKVQQDSAVGGGTMADLEGTKLTPTVNANGIVLTVIRPLERYVRVVNVIGSSSTLGDVFAIQWNGAVGPQTHETVLDTETHVSPAEGTA